MSPDASVYTFKLRKDVTFHDGTKFDATAVKATYDHIVDPATKSKSGLGALGPYKETKILDPYTVQIVFTEPNAGFLHQQAAGNFGIASPTALKKYGATGLRQPPGRQRPVQVRPATRRAASSPWSRTPPTRGARPRSARSRRCWTS